LDEEKGLFTVIELKGPGRPIVLRRTEVEAARTRILQRYQVPTERNLGKPDFEL